MFGKFFENMANKAHQAKINKLLHSRETIAGLLKLRDEMKAKGIDIAEFEDSIRQTIMAALEFMNILEEEQRIMEQVRRLS